MRRRTLDAIFVAGGLAMAVLLFVLGMVLKDNADFANGYVRDQLSEQKITFPAADALKDEEKEADCLVDNAGLLLDSGKQAECYANEYIGLHVSNTAAGETYATIGRQQSALRAQIAEAKESNDPALPDLEAQLAEVTATRETLFKGETLRGLLLTSYGFSVFGDRADTAALVCFLVALVLLLASVAGAVHALRTPKDQPVIVQHT